MPNKNEVREEFYGELNRRIIARLQNPKQFLSQEEIIKVIDEMPELERIKFMAGEKIALIEEWEAKGRNMAFLEFEDRMENLLSLRLTGKPLN